MAAGFYPSTAALICAWFYMAASGLLIAEVNINTLCSLEKNAVSIRSMAQETLGTSASALSSLAYLFIHYALLVAYILQGGQLLGEYISAVLPFNTELGPVLFAGVAGGSMLTAPQQLVERVTSALVLLLVGLFCCLVALGLPQVDVSLLEHAQLDEVVPALPVLVLSLVYHNVVPTICYQLKCDLPRIRTAICVGSALPTLMFILWNSVILGTVSYETAAAATAAGEVFDPLLLLRSSGDDFGAIVRAFSLVAILTSFVGFVYGLVDFYADAFGWDRPETPSRDLGDDLGDLPADPAAALPDLEPRDRTADAADPGEAFTRRSALYALTLLPPLGVALSDPSLFFAAIDNAGAFGIMTLFGILPAAMAWQQRYGEGSVSYAPPTVPGGRATLAAMVAVASAIVGVEALERLEPLLAAL